MEILFDQAQHRYTVNGEIASISVTALLRKHKLAPDYKGVSDAVLNAAAERGTDIHKDLECLIKYAGYTPMTKEGESFNKYIDDFIDSACAEQLLAYKYKSMWLCGTADILGFFKKAEKGCFIGDHKTTSAINREYVSWQVSILDYMLRQLKEPINGQTINWKGANEFLCFHYTKDGEMEVIKLNKVPDEEIERLFEAEYKGEIYERKALVLDDDISLGLTNLTMAIDTMEDRLAKMKEQRDKYREIIKDAMEKQGIKSFENDQVKLTYVCPQEKVIVDSAKLKKIYPQVWLDCQKVSKVKSSLKITIKGKEDE